MLRLNLQNFCLALLLVLPFTHTTGESLTLKLVIDKSDGGSLSTRKMVRFKDYLEEHDCPAVIFSLETMSTEADFDLVFVPFARLNKNWIPLLNAESVGNQWVQPAIIVRETASNDLKSLRDVHFSFVNPKSIAGYLGQTEILKRAEINLNLSKTIYADNHIGAISLLMHKDVFAAGVDSYLAEKFLQANDLKIIAKGDKSEVGGIYLNQSSKLNEPAYTSLTQRCTNAFLKLNRNSRESRKIMELFPDWLVRFVLDKSQD